MVGLVLLALLTLLASLVAVRSASAGSMVRTIGVGGNPLAVAVDEQIGRAFVLNNAGNSVSMLDSATGALLKTVTTGRDPLALAADERTGHVFQGPYTGDLVLDDEHFIAASRYIALNPVRAGLCADPAEWRWSSFRATAGLEHHPPYLVVDFTRAMFGGGVSGARAYRELVAAGATSQDLVLGLGQ